MAAIHAQEKDQTLGEVETNWPGIHYQITIIKRIPPGRLLVVIRVLATPQAPPGGTMLGFQPPIPPHLNLTSVQAAYLYPPRPALICQLHHDRREDAAEVSLSSPRCSPREGISFGCNPRGLATPPECAFDHSVRGPPAARPPIHLQGHRPNRPSLFCCPMPKPRSRMCSFLHPPRLPNQQIELYSDENILDTPCQDWHPTIGPAVLRSRSYRKLFPWHI